MDWVTENLAIGGFRDVINHAVLREEGVDALLRLCDPGGERGPDPYSPPLDAMLKLPVRDAQPLPCDLLRQGLDFIAEQHSADRKVLVACGAGISRSAAFVVAHLHERGMESSEALRTVMREHPIAFPHPELLGSLIEYYLLPTTVRALLVQAVHDRKELHQDVVRWISQPDLPDGGAGNLERPGL